MLQSEIIDFINWFLTLHKKILAILTRASLINNEASLENNKIAQFIYTPTFDFKG
jgi:hypothetical protein